MWLLIRDGVVVGAQLTRPPDLGPAVRVVEWVGPEPKIGAADPTLTDPDYPAFAAGRAALEQIESQATNELAWLDGIIPQIPAMQLAGLRQVVERLARENREMIRVWRYVVRRLG